LRVLLTASKAWPIVPIVRDGGLSRFTNRENEMTECLAAPGLKRRRGAERRLRGLDVSAIGGRSVVPNTDFLPSRRVANAAAVRVCRSHPSRDGLSLKAAI
jgi:hypothetical protein